MNYFLTHLPHKYYLLALLFFIAGKASAQAPPGFEWVQNAKTNLAGYSEAIASVTDATGNVYVMGHFADTVYFGTDTIYANHLKDIFVAKYNGAGTLLWLKTMGSQDIDDAKDISIDFTGNIYITTFAHSPTQFGSFTVPRGSAIVKMNSNGLVLWAKGIEGGVIRSIAADGMGNLFVTGDFTDTVTIGTTVVLPLIVGKSDILIAKFSNQGVLQWVKTAGGAGLELGVEINVDGSGNFYITGQFSGTCNFGPHAVTATGGLDVYIAKYNTAGSALWVNSFGSSGTDEGRGLTVSNTGSIYLTGNVNGVFFLRKYNSTGNLVWNTNSTGNHLAYGNSVVTNTNGDVFVAGDFFGSAQFGAYSLSSCSNFRCNLYNIFVARYDTNGVCQWVQKLGNFDMDVALNISADPMGNVYMAGYVSGFLNFDGSIISSFYSPAAFLAKISARCMAAATVSTVSASICAGQQYNFGGNYVSDAGTYVRTLRNAAGCDSTITLLLTINQPSTPPAVTASICRGDTFVFNNQIFSQVAGTYPFWFTNAAGCDSLVTLSLTVKEPTFAIISVDIPQGSTYTFGSQVISTAGSYTRVITNAAGCDSTITLSLTVSQVPATTPNYVWAQTQSLAIGSSTGNSIATDAAGNIYSLGSGGLVPGVLGTFLKKQYNSGILKWGIILANNYYVKGSSIAVDAAGNIYVTGSFSGTATFGTTTLTASNSWGDIFVAKYNTNGVAQWARKAGGANTTYGDHIGTTIAVDAAGNIFAGGFFTQSCTFGTTVLTSSGQRDGFLAKYNNNGTLLWATKVSSPLDDFVNSIAVDVAGNAYIGASSYATVSLGSFVLQNKGIADAIIAKYDGNGVCQWVQSPGGTAIDHAMGVAIDVNGSLHVTGYFNAPNFNATSPKDFFLAKYNSNGSQLWIKTSNNGIAAGAAVTTDNFGNAYVAGRFTGSASFGTVSLSGFVNPNVEHTDAFVVKYDANGNALWAQKGGGTDFENATGIAVDGAGNAFVIGNFVNFSVFGTFSLTGTWQSYFIAKIGQPCTTITTNPAATFCQGQGYVFGTQTLTAPGAYVQTLLSAAGCDSTVNLTLSQGTKPVAPVLTAVQDTLVATAGASSYVWFITNTNGQTTQLPVTTNKCYLAAAGCYKAVAITNGCTSDTSQAFCTTVSVKSSLPAQPISVYPNPFKENLTLQSATWEPGSVVNLVSITGTTVRSQNVIPANGKVTLSLTNLPKGIYILQINGSRASFITRVIKE